MHIGVIADDFTGASDIANTLARGIAPEGGIRTAQFAGIPDGAAPERIDAGVVSLKSRTSSKDTAVSDSLAALEWLLSQGCRQIVFKYCSTFDSTKDGNIGPVAEALADALGADKVVFCPAFPTTGRTVYQGHLFVGGAPLNESGMESHPLTPMTDADIRRWLAQQTHERIGHIAMSIVAQGADAVRSAVARSEARFLVADAINDADLATLGEALAEAALITGGSGIALGLPRNLFRAGLASAHRMHSEGTCGPAAVLAGSCSGATRGQIDVYSAAHPTLAIDVRGVMRGEVSANTLVEFFDESRGRAPLAYSSGTPDEVKALQSEFGRETVAARLDALFAETAALLIGRGYRRIVVAGGETSGAVAQAVAGVLEAPAMTVGPEIDPGVPVLNLGKERRVALALKSGNFGSPEFFSKALEKMETGA